VPVGKEGFRVVWQSGWTLAVRASADLSLCKINPIIQIPFMKLADWMKWSVADSLSDRFWLKQD
jgi:hypothetical protein